MLKLNIIKMLSYSYSFDKNVSFDIDVYNFNLDVFHSLGIEDKKDNDRFILSLSLGDTYFTWNDVCINTQDLQEIKNLTDLEIVLRHGRVVLDENIDPFWYNRFYDKTLFSNIASKLKEIFDERN